VDYCDRVSFIDSGRLIADATPEELRRAHSDGYGVTVAVPPGERAAVAAALRDAGFPPGDTANGVALRVPALAPPLLAALERLSVAGAIVHVEQPEMTDVFRRLLAERAAP
jgi:ABC-type multidrug transport system ATPase subunit